MINKIITYLALLEVCLFVEVREEVVEEHGVHADPPDEGAWVVAVNKQQLERVQEY